jgi:hypothetical protein
MAPPLVAAADWLLACMYMAAVLTINHCILQYSCDMHAQETNTACT